MIATGAITKRANQEQLPAQTVERDYVLAQVCADIGALAEERLVFKGGTLLRLCYFEDYRYSADLDFSAVDGLSAPDAVAAVADAVASCRRRLELPLLDVTDADKGAASISYIGPLGAAKARTIKLDISDDELVEAHRRIAIRPRWTDMPGDAALEGYSLDDIGAEKLRCIAERLQCRDLFDLHQLLEARYVDAMELWQLYLRKAENDVARQRQRTPPARWLSTFEQRMTVYAARWENELGDYLPGEIPEFGRVERESRRLLLPVLDAAGAIAADGP